MYNLLVSIKAAVDRIEARIQRLDAAVRAGFSMDQKQMDRLTKAVSDETSVVAGVQTLVSGLVQTIRDNVGDPTAINSALDTFEQNNAALATAVANNTPAATPASGGSATGGSAAG